jgi:hypothetical protein
VEANSDGGGGISRENKDEGFDDDDDGEVASCCRCDVENRDVVSVDAAAGKVKVKVSLGAYEKPGNADGGRGASDEEEEEEEDDSNETAPVVPNPYAHRGRGACGGSDGANASGYFDSRFSMRWVSGSSSGCS